MSTLEIIGAVLGGLIIAVVLWNIRRGGVPEDTGDTGFPPHSL